MPRPSLKSEKCEIIQQAYERCLVRYGVHGTTLQNIADEAGMARPLLHHYVGNQNQLLKACSERFVTRALANVSKIEQVSNTEELLEFLFKTPTEEKMSDMSIYAALASASAERACLKQLIAQFTKACHDIFQQKIKELYSTANDEKIRTVVIGIWGISLNYCYSKDLLDNSDVFEASCCQSVKVLLESL